MELESLIGLLYHAAQVVRLGRSFLHRFIVLLRGRFIGLNNEERADIMWWLVFLDVVSIGHGDPDPEIFLTSNVSGAWRCGGFVERSGLTAHHGLFEHITYKELIPIVLAVMAWGGAAMSVCL